MGDFPAGVTRKDVRAFYRQMVGIRQCELAARKLYKEGRLPGSIHLYIGQEATAVGVCAHLREDDYLTSTHRGHGHALAKGVPARALLAELCGKATGCSGGRGGSMHLFAADVGLYGTNGAVGAGIPPAVGLGMSARLRKTDQVAVAFFGDGAVNHSAFHEAVNLAGIQEAPVVFVCENNLYATETALSKVTRNTEIASRAASYGIPGVAVDGNDVMAVWEVAKESVERARSGKGPTLLEAKTYRTCSHHEGDDLYGTYRTAEELEEWQRKCPILRFRRCLVQSGKATEQELEAIDQEIQEEIRESVDFALSSPEPDPATARDHVRAEPVNPPDPSFSSATRETRAQVWTEAVRDGIAEEMRRDPCITYFGEGIAERGGSFGHTRGLWKEFGAQRVIDTPISELGFTGAAIGLAAAGSPSVADLMVSDFLFDAMSQIIHQAAKLRYMSNGQISVPVVVRAGTGLGRSTGPHHSGAYHPIWAHQPGLNVVMPSSPADAKGLFKTALRGSDPVIFLEPKSLFSMKDAVPAGEYLIPFGKARVVHAGNDLTIISCGLLLHRCVEAMEELEREGLSCEIIDLRTIVPLDVNTIVESVARTGRALIVDEAFAMCGIGAEISALIMENTFEQLDAPAGRLHSEPVATPYSPALAKATSVTVEKIVSAARAVATGRPIILSAE